MALITRIDKDALAGLLGKAAFDRLQNKIRGGDNAYKGSRYEHLFLAHRVARLVKKYLETGIDATVEWQSDGL